MPTAEEDGMFLDPLEELYRKPDPTMADGQNLTSMYGRFPQELLGCQIEDIDFYYRSKKVLFNSFIRQHSLDSELLLATSENLTTT